MRFTRQFLASIALALPTCVMGQWHSGGSIETSHNDNSNRSTEASSAVGIQLHTLSLWSSFHQQLADYTAVDASGSVEHQHAQQLSGLTNDRFGVTTALTHKFGLGDKPVLTLAMHAERANYNDERRDLWLYRSSANLRLRQNARWVWSATLSHEFQNGDLDEARSAAAPGSAFDWHAWQASFDSEWELTENSWLKAAVFYRSGDITASMLRNVAAIAIATAISNDPLFGANYVAYRVAADTRGMQLEWNRSVSDNTTLTIGAERQWTEANSALRYGNTIIRAGLFHEF